MACNTLNQGIAYLFQQFLELQSEAICGKKRPIKFIWSHAIFIFISFSSRITSKSAFYINNFFLCLSLGSVIAAAIKFYIFGKINFINFKSETWLDDAMASSLIKIFSYDARSQQKNSTHRFACKSVAKKGWGWSK